MQHPDKPSCGLIRFDALLSRIHVANYSFNTMTCSRDSSDWIFNGVWQYEHWPIIVLVQSACLVATRILEPTSLFVSLGQADIFLAIRQTIGSMFLPIGFH